MVLIVMPVWNVELNCRIIGNYYIIGIVY